MFVFKQYQRLVNQADGTFFSSHRIAKNYGKEATVIYPWTYKNNIKDVDEVKQTIKRRNRILFWGPVGRHVDLDKSEAICMENERLKCGYKIEICGPIGRGMKKHILHLEKNYSCFAYATSKTFPALEPSSVAAALQVINPLNSEFANMIEVPNKIPNFLAYGIPVFYSGCNLISLEGGVIQLRSPYEFLIDISNEAVYLRYCIDALKSAHILDEKVIQSSLVAM